MALTNIELYEELKKDLSERAARLIAEIVPKADDLATKGDVARLEANMERRFASLERRFFVLFAVPLWGAVAAGIVKLFVH